MRVGTMVSLGASAALGLGALFVAKVALPAHSNVAVAAAPAPVVSGVPVVVAAKDIKYGERLDASHLKLVQIPRDAAPTGAFATVEQSQLYLETLRASGTQPVLVYRKGRSF